MKKGFNEYEIRNNITAIFLKNKKGEKYETLIDTEDLQRLIDLDYHWHLKWDNHSKSYYVKTTLRENKNNKGSLHLHSLIMNTQPKIRVDHINHNTLDNRKQFLKITTNKKILRIEKD